MLENAQHAVAAIGGDRERIGLSQPRQGFLHAGLGRHEGDELAIIEVSRQGEGRRGALLTEKLQKDLRAGGRVAEVRPGMIAGLDRRFTEMF